MLITLTSPYIWPQMQTTEVILVLFLVWQLSAIPIPVWMASAFFGVDAEDYNSKPGWAENKFSFERNCPERIL